MSKIVPFALLVLALSATSAAWGAKLRGAAVWVAPGYGGPVMNSYSWPRHGARSCATPACFGYHAGTWQAWPCPDEPMMPLAPMSATGAPSPNGVQEPTPAPLDDVGGEPVPGLLSPDGPLEAPMPADPNPALEVVEPEGQEGAEP